MFCTKCGATIPDGANFCPKCGVPVDRMKGRPEKNEVKTIQFRCKGCGHVMEIDPDSPILRCPVCGSNELILEGDDVTVQRIKSNTYKDVELGRQQTYREVELGKRELELRENKIRFGWHILSYLIILVGAVGTYWGFINVSPVGLLIGIIVLIAGIVSTRFSKKAPKEEKRLPEVIPPSAHYESKEHYKPKEYTYGHHVTKEDNYGHHATKEDIELAKVCAEERTDKISLIVVIVVAVLLVLIFGAIIVMVIFQQT